MVSPEADALSKKNTAKLALERTNLRKLAGNVSSLTKLLYSTAPFEATDKAAAYSKDSNCA
ncbi:hypothetical protein [Leptolyngbya sp. BC1307]|uniref:hypothetical protein n=1 Tax=Leptolyngbya sp. BC1307 TaxID=2029589 RepID=UPI000EFC1774|nr:hypothetical protein [Leptolyngbya sp. BC1307]